MLGRILVGLQFGSECRRGKQGNYLAFLSPKDKLETDITEGSFFSPAAV